MRTVHRNEKRDQRVSNSTESPRDTGRQENSLSREGAGKPESRKGTTGPSRLELHRKQQGGTGRERAGKGGIGRSRAEQGGIEQVAEHREGVKRPRGRTTHMCTSFTMLHT